MQPIDGILAVAADYDSIVFDQWGVLHDGSTPYPEAVAAVERLAGMDVQLSVLSNSGKRADVNRDRITAMGFPADAFDVVMTSGEALALDLAEGRLPGIERFLPITAVAEDAGRWANGLKIEFTGKLADADVVLLMGVPDAEDHPQERDVLSKALERNLPLFCSNPDLASPRAGGKLVESPGALAHEYAEKGGQVTFYGKPHRPIFDTLFTKLRATSPDRVLMVGDSPEHDIAGAHGAGWNSLFISGGLHAGETGNLFGDMRPPTYILPTLR